MCLAHSAGVVPTSQSLADMQDHAPAIGRYIRNLMSGNHISFSSSSSSKSVETNPVQIYIGLLQQLLAGVGGKKLCGAASLRSHLLEMSCHTPSTLNLASAITQLQHRPYSLQRKLVLFYAAA